MDIPDLPNGNQFSPLFLTGESSGYLMFSDKLFLKKSKGKWHCSVQRSTIQHRRSFGLYRCQKRRRERCYYLQMRPSPPFRPRLSGRTHFFFLSRLLSPARVLLISAKNLGNRRNSSFFFPFFFVCAAGVIVLRKKRRKKKVGRRSLRRWKKKKKKGWKRRICPKAAKHR